MGSVALIKCWPEFLSFGQEVLPYASTMSGTSLLSSAVSEFQVSHVGP